MAHSDRPFDLPNQHTGIARGLEIADQLAHAFVLQAAWPTLAHVLDTDEAISVLMDLDADHEASQADEHAFITDLRTTSPDLAARYTYTPSSATPNKNARRSGSPFMGAHSRTAVWLLLAWLVAVPAMAQPVVRHLPAGRHTGTIILPPGSLLSGDGASTELHVGVSATGIVAVGAGGLGVPSWSSTITTIRDLTIICDSPNSYGLQIETSFVRVERVQVRGCYFGIRVLRAVDVQVRESIIKLNYVNVYFEANQPITTVTISSCNIRESTYAGLLLFSGYGITLTDNTIIESNKNVGLWIAPMGWVGAIRLNGVWFENNPTDIVGQSYITTLKDSVFF